MVLQFSYHFSEPWINNKVEYEALITNLKMAISLSIAGINLYIKPKLIQYHKHIMSLLIEIEEVIIYKLPRSGNVVANTLAKLANGLAYLINELIFRCIIDMS